MAQKKDKKFDYAGMIKGITKSITDWGSIQGEKTKIMSSLLSNNIKAKQNFFYKLQTQKAQQIPLQKIQQQEAQPQPYSNPTISGVGTRVGYPSAPPRPFSEQARPQVGMGAKGLLTARTPPPKEWVYNRILEKEKRGFDLTRKEEKFKEKYLGLGTTFAESKKRNLLISMIIGEKKENVPLEEIEETIRVAGFDPRDFAEELRDYQPESPEPNFFQKFFQKGNESGE